MITSQAFSCPVHDYSVATSRITGSPFADFPASFPQAKSMESQQGRLQITPLNCSRYIFSWGALYRIQDPRNFLLHITACPLPCLHSLALICAPHQLICHHHICLYSLLSLPQPLLTYPEPLSQPACRPHQSTFIQHCMSVVSPTPTILLPDSHLFLGYNSNEVYCMKYIITTSFRDVNPGPKCSHKQRVYVLF